MGLRNSFIQTDRHCVAHGGFTPDAAVAAAATDFDITLTLSTGATVGSVTFDWGDGTSATVATLDAGTTYTASHTYASAGSYVVKVTTVLSNAGETWTDNFNVTVSA